MREEGVDKRKKGVDRRRKSIDITLITSRIVITTHLQYAAVYAATLQDNIVLHAEWEMARVVIQSRYRTMIAVPFLPGT